jgi:hypothetical protein
MDNFNHGAISWLENTTISFKTKPTPYEMNVSMGLGFCFSAADIRQALFRILFGIQASGLSPGQGN